jgi:hypothetical protein
MSIFAHGFAIAASEQKRNALIAVITRQSSPTFKRGSKNCESLATAGVS